MPSRSPVPELLRHVPFTAAEASAAGVTRGQLRGPSYRRLRTDVYGWVGLQDSPQVRLKAVAKHLPVGAAFSGHTAAWLHGLDVSPCDPIEVTIPAGSRRRTGALIRRAALTAEEIQLRSGLPTTSSLRTAVDLAGRNPLTEGVVTADAFLHAGLVTIAELTRYVDEHPRAMGIARLRSVLALVEPKTESPMETRLRMLLMLAGLPRPEVQTPLLDEDGRFLCRPDLLYRAERIAIEFDGGNHRDRLVEDNRRQNQLIGAGWYLLRFSAPDVYRTPDRVVKAVRRGLARRLVRDGGIQPATRTVYDQSSSLGSGSS